MTRLVSPWLHRLPAHLAVEFAPHSPGNRNAKVLAKLKTVWYDDVLAGRCRARIVIFANTRARAGEMGLYLSKHGIPNIVVTGHGKGKCPGGSGQRVRGSNRHLAGFLKPMPTRKGQPQPRPPSAGEKEEDESEQERPRVLLSTSLLARGLDFDPSVSHVFVLDPPRNTADFLHRAGRTARAGRSGKVVVFGKGAGRGSGKVREMRRRVAMLRGARR
jgi:ATP-dependent RNA helicase MRH4, mitochondrial